MFERGRERRKENWSVCKRECVREGEREREREEEREREGKNVYMYVFVCVYAPLRYVSL